MTVAEIIEWLKNQPQETVAEFKDGVNHYRWGEDLPSFSEFSEAFELGWRFARLQHGTQ